MSAEAQRLIQEVRAAIARGDYAQAQTVLDRAPADRTDWTPQERDEVVCLAEFLENLKSPFMAR